MEQIDIDNIEKYHIKHKNIAVVFPYDFMDENDYKVINAGKDGLSLDECYKAIDCELVELIHVTPNVIMIVDEEGSLKMNRQINPVASAIMGYNIYGNIILTHTSNFK